jgi:alpha/beta superfamily hydrolase
VRSSRPTESLEVGLGTQQQRAVAIALGDDALEGLFVAESQAGSGGAIVAPPHPLYGGNMDSPVVNEIAHACHTAGFASLCFNWRGVGASAGTPSGETDAADADYTAAVEHLADTVDPPLVACGYSFGAATALRVGCAQPTVRKLVLVAPPPALLDPAQLDSFPGRVLVVAGDQDAIAPAAVLAELVAEVASATFRAIPEADHFFGVDLRDIRQAVSEFLGAS